MSYTLYNTRKTPTRTIQNAVVQMLSYISHHYCPCLIAVSKWKLFLQSVNHHGAAVREAQSVVLMQSSKGWLLCGNQ